MSLLSKNCDVRGAVAVFSAHTLVIQVTALILERNSLDDKQNIVAAGINRLSINSGKQMAIETSMPVTQAEDNTLAAHPTELRLLIATK
jgi:hypothetical protein